MIFTNLMLIKLSQYALRGRNVETGMTHPEGSRIGSWVGLSYSCLLKNPGSPEGETLVRSGYAP